jgi:hypothetical protein
LREKKSYSTKAPECGFCLKKRFGYMEKNITNPKPNQTVREQQRERNGGYGIDDERQEERLYVCV